jgi:hypothetical protein
VGEIAMNTPRAYLSVPARVSALSVLVLLLAGYQTIGRSDPYSKPAAVLLACEGVALVARWSRAVCYAFLVLLLALSTFGAVFVAATGPQDASADRDDAAEIGARAFLHGRNPCGQKTPLGS